MKKSEKKTLLFSVTIKDCRVETFTVGGPGGGGKDTSNTGVRITHEPSGAVGRAVETRVQSQNKRLAFERMANSQKFRTWAKLEASKRMGRETLEQAVDRMMAPENLRIEEF